MRFTEQFLDELRSRLSIREIAGRHVSWDPGKSRPAVGEYWACCPFHSEKTPSFHIKEHDGFFKCFSCEAGGGTIQFYQKINNLNFPEAVERLAEIAGMPLPAATPEDRQRADKATELSAMAEEAAKFYRLNLDSSSGRAARDYLRTRGLSPEDCRRYGIGFAPPGGVLLRHFAKHGYGDDAAVEAGLAGKSSDGDGFFDWFRNRIVFPIRSRRGKVIAFGGRSMDPNARAKYLNSPETLIFKKGNCLYNYAAAREAIAKGQPLVLAEGYMDVIALSQGGLEASVAPLGTAVTRTQLSLLWKMSPEPVIALDGDQAGFAAAIRVIFTALPHLGHSRTLRFCLLPEGMDPDDLIAQRGADAMKNLIEQAIPLHKLLWLSETRGRQFNSPEQRAGLQARLNSAIEKIPDGNLRKQYFTEFKSMMWNSFGNSRSQRERKFGGTETVGMPLNETRTSLLAQAAGKGGGSESIREAVILGICLNYPELVTEFESQLEELDTSVDDHAEVRDMILKHAGIGDPAEFKARVASAVGAKKVERILGQRYLEIVPAIANAECRVQARAVLDEEIQKLFADRSAREAFKEARLDIETDAEFALSCIKGAKANLRKARNHSRDDSESGLNPTPVNENDRNSIDEIIARI
ncbi:MAG: DNA primase [Albidovulum sp.]|nr:DNA primase [Albidovulum sp.]